MSWLKHSQAKTSPFLQAHCSLTSQSSPGWSSPENFVSKESKTLSTSLFVSSTRRHWPSSQLGRSSVFPRRRQSESNYAFKPTAEDGSRVNQSLSCGGGLTRRWASR